MREDTAMVIGVGPSEPILSIVFGYADFGTAAAAPELTRRHYLILAGLLGSASLR